MLGGRLVPGAANLDSFTLDLRLSGLILVRSHPDRLKIFINNKRNANKADSFSTTVTHLYLLNDWLYTFVQFGNSLVTILSMFLPTPPENTQTNHRIDQMQARRPVITCTSLAACSEAIIKKLRDGNLFFLFFST